jgi:hypothetical protein
MKVLFAVLVLCALLWSASFVVVCHGVSEADAASAVSNADETVIGCYRAAANAEQAGANVSSLLVTLDDSGLLLSEAHLALLNGSFDSASALAGQCVAMLEGFNGTADGLKSSASQAGFVDFWVNFFGSAVGAVAVVVAGFLVWRFSKGKKPVKAGAV